MIFEKDAILRGHFKVRARDFMQHRAYTAGQIKPAWRAHVGNGRWLRFAWTRRREYFNSVLSR